MGRCLAVLSCLAVGSALVASTAEAHYALNPSYPCDGLVSFQPNTDYAAYAFSARELRCRDAYKVARRYERGGDHTPYGFDCVYRGRQRGDRHDAMGHTDVRCKRRQRAVVFVIS